MKTAAELGLPEGFDFTDPELYGNRMPHEEFATLRREAPVWWNPQPQHGRRIRRRGILGDFQTP